MEDGYVICADGGYLSKGKKPRENYNWCDLSVKEKNDSSRWFCGTCDGHLEEHFDYCCWCGTKINWEV